jgi:hypothetical protein
MSKDQCQNLDLDPASKRVSRVPLLKRQVEWYLKNRGLLSTGRRIWSLLVARTQQRAPFRRKQARRQSLGSNDEVQGLQPGELAKVKSEDEVLGLQPGELVEVKSEDEILRTLDGEQKHRGLSFDTEMYEYCGRRLRVFRRVELICMESRPSEVRRLKNTVTLEGALCGGKSIGCGRACFYFWREVWLKRVEED